MTNIETRRKFLGRITALAGTALIVDRLTISTASSEFEIPIPYPTPAPNTAPSINLPIFEPLPSRIEVPTSPPTPLPTPEPTPTPEPKFIANDIFYFGDPSKPYIYLTIDDCFDPKSVEAALDIAKAYNIKLTFFPIGYTIPRNPDLYKRMVKEGHAVENHSQNHWWLPNLTEAGIRAQITDQKKTLESVLGFSYEQKFFRPSGGGGILGGNIDSRIPKICKELGYKVAMWNDDSRGYTLYPRTDAQAQDLVATNVKRLMTKGAIVLQHAISTDIVVLPKIIEMAKASGLKPITMAEGIS